LIIEDTPEAGSGDVGSGGDSTPSIGTVLAELVPYTAIFV